MENKMFDLYGFYNRPRTNNSVQNILNDETGCEGSCAGENMSCDCPLTMAFVNSQPLESVYPLEEGFDNGTIFPSLNKPFFGGAKK